MSCAKWLGPIRNRLRTLWVLRRTVSRRIHASYRPRLEVLEDRTVLSPTLVADINQLPVDANPHNLVSLGGELYFVANDGVHGNQLWKSDGTPDGAVMVTDINPGGQAGLNPGGLTVLGHNLVFSATDGLHG